MKRHLLLVSTIAIVGLLANDSLAQAQEKTPATPPAPATKPAIPASSTTGAIDKTPTGKPVEVPANQVIADPATKMYQLCMTSDEQAAPVDAAAAKKPARPPGDQMSEEEAKSRGFRPGAHKVNCTG